MEPGHIEIFCTNPLKSKDFYVDVLGFELMEVQANKFVWLNKNESLILLRPGKKVSRSLSYQNTNIALVLYTKDLAAAVEELTSRGLRFKGTDGSDKCLTFTDPDGNWFQLVNPDDH
jgi:catechol 2,3-dioxygenase-like lactoylglutathione lyase family enzyme